MLGGLFFFSIISSISQRLKIEKNLKHVAVFVSEYCPSFLDKKFTIFIGYQSQNKNYKMDFSIASEHCATFLTNKNLLFLREGGGVGVASLHVVN